MSSDHYSQTSRTLRYLQDTRPNFFNRDLSDKEDTKYYFSIRPAENQIPRKSHLGHKQKRKGISSGISSRKRTSSKTKSRYGYPSMISQRKNSFFKNSNLNGENEDQDNDREDAVWPSYKNFEIGSFRGKEKRDKRPSIFEEKSEKSRNKKSTSNIFANTLRDLHAGDNNQYDDDDDNGMYSPMRTNTLRRTIYNDHFDNNDRY